MKQYEFGGAKPHTGTAEALVANIKQMPVTRHYDQCRYCEKRHWSVLPIALSNKERNN